MNIIKTPIEIKNELIRPFPDYLIKQKPGQAKASYVTGQTVIDKLNYVFGHLGWSWEVERAWIEQSADKVVKVKWENKKKIELDTPIYEKQLPVAHVIGKLTVNLRNEDGSLYSICKSAPGAQPLTGGQSEQENCFKGAHTDALKKAATMFGIALELYRDNIEAQHFENLTYIDPWTDEAKIEYDEYLNYIEKYKTDYQIDDNDFIAFANSITGEEIGLTPNNIVAVVEYIQEALANQE